MGSRMRANHPRRLNKGFNLTFTLGQPARHTFYEGQNGGNREIKKQQK